MLLFLRIPQMPPYSKLSFSASSQISPSLPCSLPACGSSVAAARIPCSHPSPAHVQPAELSWSECAFSAGELAVLQDFATPVLPSDVKCFVEEADLNTSLRVEPSFSSSVKGARLLVHSPKCVGVDSFPYYLLSTWTASPCRCSAR